ncbi:hypothetical protein DPV78_007891 [Talaromyces pinophilus]|nr:hypothetical protein DPV78_007891 [Talaromyces pinophilus]
MKRHEGRGYLDRIDPYSYSKEIEENENGSEDGDIAEEDITNENVEDEDFDVGTENISICLDDYAYLSDGEIEIDDDSIGSCLEFGERHTRRCRVHSNTPFEAADGFIALLLHFSCKWYQTHEFLTSLEYPNQVTRRYKCTDICYASQQYSRNADVLCVPVASFHGFRRFYGP